MMIDLLIVLCKVLEVEVQSSGCCYSVMICSGSWMFLCCFCMLGFRDRNIMKTTYFKAKVLEIH